MSIQQVIEKGLKKLRLKTGGLWEGDFRKILNEIVREAYLAGVEQGRKMDCPPEDEVVDNYTMEDLGRDWY